MSILSEAVSTFDHENYVKVYEDCKPIPSLVRNRKPWKLVLIECGRHGLGIGSEIGTPESNFTSRSKMLGSEVTLFR